MFKGGEGRWEQQKGRGELGLCCLELCHVSGAEATGLGGFPWRKWCLCELCVSSVPVTQSGHEERAGAAVEVNPFVQPLRLLPILHSQSSRAGLGFLRVL